MKNELPPGWISCPLGDLVKIQNGFAFPSNEFRQTGVPLMRQSNLDGDKVSLEKCVYLDPKWLRVKPNFILQKGDVLIGMSGSVGKLCIYHLDKPALQNQRTGKIVLRSPEYVESRFIWEYLKTIERQLLDKGKGLGVLNVSAGDIESLPIRLPPLNEQRRIVAKLEKLLSRVNTAQERLATIPHILKRFRQSVLAAACSGRLTADWRHEGHNFELAADFVRRVQEERKANYERDHIAAKNENGRGPKRPKNNFIATIEEADPSLPDWCVTQIGDVTDCLDHLRIPVNKAERLERQGVIPYYGANGQVGWIDSFLFDEDLVFVVEDETFIGREKPFSYVVRGKSWVNNHAHVLRSLGGMSAEFLNLCLSYYNFTPLTSGTTGRRKLNQEALLEAPIVLPPLAEQQEIVRRVDALFKTADALEARYRTAKAHVDKLTQSILARAFRGELVRQDPNDDPAEILLARINHNSVSR